MAIPHPHLSAKSLRWISDQYFGMNGTFVETLGAPPTPLEFSRLAHVSRPVIIKGASSSTGADWTNEYLTQAMGQQRVSVSVTPNGRADSITRGSDGKLYFTEPCTEQITMSELLGSLNDEANQEVMYLQSQNGNLYTNDFFTTGTSSTEFEPLRKNVPSEVSWCSRAFGRPPDAVNLWIGNHKSHTSIHSDPYENIYTVVRGAKHFLLLPPTEGWCVQEHLHPHATYERSPEDGRLSLAPSNESVPPVRWASVTDPHLPDSLPDGAHPIEVTLHAGDTLYLPVGWWHHVRQSHGVTIALNWWYDAEMAGGSWTWLSLLRGIEDEVATEEDDVNTTAA
ncbi:Clavaminate synthase-like protein [Pterulicium gracile]|uniref:Clavaminate synthase-like protein n=1 Tax=Pterulicium gracile TaxID=1884261 RepID=A0A5C3QX95_9AGAR|nr:Clavaminate synthase-like protein [Pterula gracilis]